MNNSTSRDPDHKLSLGRLRQFMKFSQASRRKDALRMLAVRGIIRLASHEAVGLSTQPPGS